jgi:hypothetical protein
MKILDMIKLSIILIFFGGFLYIIADTIISEQVKKQKSFKIESNSGNTYWADSVHMFSKNEIGFFDVISKRNVKIYGQFTISTPKK